MTTNDATVDPTTGNEVAGDPRDLPSRTATTQVGRGELGRKTRTGFYTSDPDGTRYPRTEQETR